MCARVGPRSIQIERLEARCLLSAATTTPWQPIGPNGGTVFALERDPFQTTTLLAGTYFGGLYRSVDQGLSWAGVASPFSSLSVFSIAFDPLHQGTIFAGVYQGGVYKSTDSGVTWAAANQGITDVDIQGVSVDPVNADTLLASTNSGVFRSTNGGSSWALSNGGLTFSAKVVAFDSLQKDVAYLGTLDQGVLRSTDDGQHWTPLTTGMGKLPVNSLTFARTGSADGALLAGTNGGAFELPAEASTWTSIGANLPAGSVNDVEVNPVTGQLFAVNYLGVYAAAGSGAVPTSWSSLIARGGRLLRFDPLAKVMEMAPIAGSPLVSIDNGNIWYAAERGMQNVFVGSLNSTASGGTSLLYAGGVPGTAVSGPPTADGMYAWLINHDISKGIFSIVSPPGAPKTAYAGVEGLGVWKTTDGGAHWTQSSTGLLPTHVFGISTSTVGTKPLYAATDEGLFLSHDTGATWTPVVAALVNCVAASPVLPGVAFCALGTGGIYRTIDDGKTFGPIGIGVPDENIVSLKIAPWGNIYAITVSGKLYASSDLGQNWYSSSTGITSPVTSIEIRPDQPWIVYAGTAAGSVFKTTSAAIKWVPTANGLGTGDVRAIAVDPTHTSTVYVGKLNHVFKSINGGVSWANATATLPAGNVTSLKVDPTNGNVVYASIQGAGVFVSKDAGHSWAKIQSGAVFAGVIPLEIGPGTKPVLYAGTLRGGVYRTADSGAHWTTTSSGMTPFVRALAIDSAHPNTMFAGSLQSGIFRSNDAGKTWTYVGLDNVNIFSLTIDPAVSTTIFAGTSNGVARSLDGGATWKMLGQQIPFIYATVSDPRNRNVFYIAGAEGQLFRTTDGGKTWNIRNDGLPLQEVYALAMNLTTGVLYASPEKQGIYRSTDDGVTWTRISTSAVANQKILGITVAGSTLLAGTDGGGLIRSTDGGITWTSANTGIMTDVIASISVDPFVSNRLYAAAENQASTGTSVYLSINGGTSWAPSATGITNDLANMVVPDSATKGLLYVATSAGVFRSTDSAAHWTPLGLAGINVLSLTIDVGDLKTLYAATATNGLYVTRDQGGHWSSAGPSLSATPASALAIGPAGTVYAMTLGAGFTRSADHGATWSPLVEPQNVQPIVTATAINPQNRSEIYAATGTVGIMRSLDGGITWQPINNGLTNIYLLAMVMDPAKPQTLYAGTEGNGLFVTDDGGATWTPLGTGLENANITSIALDALDHSIIYVGVEGRGTFRLKRS